MRQKKCKSCGIKFIPSRPLQFVCSPLCAIEYGRVKGAKEQRKVDKAKRESLKTRSQWMKEAQAAFNKYIRLRDRDKACICCGLPLTLESIGGGYDAGHYRSVGSAPHLRFNEDNVHAQRKQCNRYGSGRAVDYRIGLIKRIGLARVEFLESDQSIKKYTIEDLKAIKEKYRKLANDLQKQLDAK